MAVAKGCTPREGVGASQAMSTSWDYVLWGISLNALLCANVLSCCRLEVVGNPSASNVLVFNGDFVDRGAWCAAAASKPLLLRLPCHLLRPSCCSSNGRAVMLRYSLSNRCQLLSCRHSAAARSIHQGPSLLVLPALPVRGLETLVLLAAWKLALPRSIFLLRGNHESATCTLMYGFKGELTAKYGKSHWRVSGAGQAACMGSGRG